MSDDTPTVLVLADAPDTRAELEQLDAIGACFTERPLMLPPHVAELCMERYGRLPTNTVIVEGVPVVPEPRTIVLGAAFCQTVGRTEFAQVAGYQFLMSSRGKQRAQWKRERIGRRS